MTAKEHGRKIRRCASISEAPRGRSVFKSPQGCSGTHPVGKDDIFSAPQSRDVSKHRRAAADRTLSAKTKARALSAKTNSRVDYGEGQEYRVRPEGGPTFRPTFRKDKPY
jgi:hypothetical protein